MKRTLSPKENNLYNRGKTKGGYKKNPIKSHQERRRIDEESLQMMREYSVSYQRVQTNFGKVYSAS